MVPRVWTRTDAGLPQEGAWVLTLTELGLEQTLVRRGRLWFTTDERMYVYYVPFLWRHLTPEELKASGKGE